MSDTNAPTHSHVDTNVQLNNNSTDTGGSPPAGSDPAASNPAASATATQGDSPAVPSQEGPADASGDPKRFQQSDYKRISRQRASAERRAMRAEAELEALRRGQSAPQPQQSTELKQSDYATYDDYNRALLAETARRAAEEVLKSVREDSSKREAESQAKQVRSSFEQEASAQAKALGIDFDDAWETLLSLPKEDVSDAFAEYFFAAADNKAALAHHFAQNTDEVARISSLHPAVAFKELAKLDLQLGAKARPNVTGAPPPVPTVGGRSVVTASPKDMSMDDYAAHRRAQMDR